LVTHGDKPLAWLHGEVKTPPFSPTARLEAGYLQRQLQMGKALSMPQSRPLPVVVPGATSCGSRTPESPGGSFTGLIRMPS
jgi:hypothetical protein